MLQGFFVCLSQNEKSWPDIYSLVSFDMTGSTTYGNCKYLSQSHSTHSIYELPIPRTNTNLATFIENLFNNGNEVENNCTNCKKKSMGIHRKTLTNVTNTQFIVLLISRVLETLDGYEFIQNRVNSTGNVYLR